MGRFLKPVKTEKPSHIRVLRMTNKYREHSIESFDALRHDAMETEPTLPRQAWEGNSLQIQLCNKLLHLTVTSQKSNATPAFLFHCNGVGVRVFRSSLLCRNTVYTEHQCIMKVCNLRHNTQYDCRHPSFLLLAPDYTSLVRARNNNIIVDIER